MVLRRAPLRHRLGLLLIVTGVVVLDDVILAAEEGNHSCGEQWERWVFNGNLLPEVGRWVADC